MTKGLGAWLFGYGFILFACGVVAYLFNPAYRLLLLVPAVAGGIMAAFGVISIKGAAWVRMVATFLTLVFMMIGMALAMQYGLRVIKESTGQIEASLSFVIFLASGAVLWRLKKQA